MKLGTVFKHEFVEFIPDELEQGTLYVSIRFATASHLCCCGCGNKVVTPIRPTDWKLIFDGKTVSLEPSIGNWSFPCQSHYWIRNNHVNWASQWTDDRIERGRLRDRQAKGEYFGDLEAAAAKDADEIETSKPKRNWWQRIRSRWS